MKKLSKIAVLGILAASYSCSSEAPKETITNKEEVTQEVEIKEEEPKHIAFTSNELYPEGVAYSEQSNTFYLSSIHYGTIGKLDWEGNYTVFIESDELISTIGMIAHDGTNLLYVAISDPGASVKTDASTQGKLAKLAAYDLTSGEQKFIVNLGALNDGGNFANDIALDKDGNIYVTNSFSPIIFKVTSDGEATVFATSELWTGEGFNLNGITYHSDGYLLTVKSNSGELFKVDLADPTNVIKVNAEAIVGGDGLVLNNSNELIVISNSQQAAFKLSSNDSWASATTNGSVATEYTFPTTGVFVNGKNYVLNAKLNEVFDPNTPNTSDFLIQEVNF